MVSIDLSTSSLGLGAKYMVRFIKEVAVQTAPPFTSQEMAKAIRANVSGQKICSFFKFAIQTQAMQASIATPQLL